MTELPRNVLRTADLDAPKPWPLPPPFAATRTPLVPGEKALLGAGIVEVPPGTRSCPLHSHRFEEEHFLVLAGELVVRELHPGANDYVEYALHPGELVAYPSNTGIAHGFFNRGDVPARFLAVSEDRWGEICQYPDSGKTMLRPLQKVGIFGATAADVVLAEAAERASGRRVTTLADDDRPSWVASPSLLVERDLGGDGFGLPLAREAGAVAVFLNRDRLPPGGRTGPLHAHTGDEELVYVLEGTPLLQQLRGTVDKRVPRFEDATLEEVRLQPGDVVRWRPADGVAHHILNPPDAPEAVLLVVGTDVPDDVCIFPDTGRVHVRALGRTASFAPRSYFDGEAD